MKAHDTITIVIECTNSAFEDNPHELPRILRGLADAAEQGEWTAADFIGKRLRDTNGNTVGRVFGKLPNAPSVT